MVVATVATGWIAIRLRRRDGVRSDEVSETTTPGPASVPGGAHLRVARPSTRRRLAAKTGGQIVVVWGFALVVLPAVAARVEQP